MGITIKLIQEEKKADILLPNEPFQLFGKLLPAYSNGVWTYSKVILPEEEVTSMCFPEENFQYEAMKDQYTFIGAYDKEQCIGLGIFQEAWNKYLYLYDLKVKQTYRGKDVGRQILDKGKELSLLKGYHGIYTIGQDNNLGACLFYLKNGFVIGGLDTCVYRGTSQEGKADVHFYWNYES